MAQLFDQQQQAQPKSALARSLNAALSGCTEWVTAPPRPRTNTLVPPHQSPQAPYGVETRRAA
jgi:hypothetical protein